MNETNLSELKINYLSDEQYEIAKTNNEINDNELYFTPDVDDEEGGSDIEIVDNLTSTSSTAALSANQGRVLNEKINNLETLNDNVLVDYRVAPGGEKTVIFNNLPQFNDNYKFKIIIVGLSTADSDISVQINNITDNLYNQMGQYRNGTNTSDVSNYQYATGTRLKKNRFYYAFSIRNNLTNINAELSKTSNVIYMKWASQSITDAGKQFDSNCFGYLYDPVSRENTSITFSNDSGFFRENTRFLIKKEVI